MCENDSYVFKDNKTDVETNRINIAQNEHGVDTEDRIIKLQNSLISYQ